MLSTTLNTNEVKNSSGVEIEFQSLGIEGRTHKFAMVGEPYALPVRLTISHEETGSGLKKRRRSLIRFDKTSISGVDAVTPVSSGAYLVTDTPVGALTSNSPAADVLAMLCSLVSTLGTNTHLYDGTGNGAQVLLNGTL